MTRRCAAALLPILAAGCLREQVADEPVDPYEGYAFVAYEFAQDSAPDARVDRLCDEVTDPVGAVDKVFIHCRTEGARFSAEAAEPKSRIVVMTWNLERGLRLDAQIAAFRNGAITVPDVLLVSEADRGCWRTGYRNVARELAEALSYDYVFATEFVELPRPTADGSMSAPCEHGNAILSRYPIGNVEAVRHTQNFSWYDDLEEPRLGGRIALVADIQVGRRYLHVASIHFESSLTAVETIEAQATETAELVGARPFGCVVGGDTNAPFYFIDLLHDKATDPATVPFFDRGFVDTHDALPVNERGTRDGLILDLLLMKPAYVRAFNPRICIKELCGALSDHLPVWATFAFDDAHAPDD
jgi:endonuclease/exonuclease/phosphatase family metal-dependent hydrolase